MFIVLKVCKDYIGWRVLFHFLGGDGTTELQGHMYKRPLWSMEKPHSLDLSNNSSCGVQPPTLGINHPAIMVTPSMSDTNQESEGK